MHALSICITDNICVTSRSACGGQILELDCSVDELPEAIPKPTITWFRNGQRAVFDQPNHQSTFVPDIDFLMQFPILTFGVFDFEPVYALPDGQLVLINAFRNINNSMLGHLPSNITIDMARAQLFNIFIANWTCVSNNSLGSDAISYNIIRNCHCGKLKLSITSYINRIVNLKYYSIPLHVIITTPTQYQL